MPELLERKSANREILLPCQIHGLPAAVSGGGQPQQPFTFYLDIRAFPALG